MTPTQIIQHLTAIQHDKGVSDDTLIKAMGVHRSTIWRIKTGKVPVTLQQTFDIARTLGIEIILK